MIVSRGDRKRGRISGAGGPLRRTSPNAVFPTSTCENDLFRLTHTVLSEISFPIFAVLPKFAPNSKQGLQSSAKLIGYSARPSPVHNTRDVHTPHAIHIVAPPSRYDLGRYLNISKLRPTRLSNDTVS
jgi:hypothetical protein